MTENRASYGRASISSTAVADDWLPIAISVKPVAAPAPAPGSGLDQDPSVPEPPREGTRSMLRYWTSADEAQHDMRACREALEGHFGNADAAQDALFFLLCAKVREEFAGKARGLAGDPSDPSSRSAKALRRCSEFLEMKTSARWPVPALDLAIGGTIATTIGDVGLLATIAEPGGPEIMRAAYREVTPTGAPHDASPFGDDDLGLQLMDTAAFKSNSAGLRALTVAGCKAYGTLGTLKARNRQWMRGNYKRGDIRLTNFPKLIHVEMSTACNIRCRTCSITRPGRTRELGYLSMETMERLRPALPFISDCKIHGGGEPFLHPQIDQMIQVFRDEGVRLNTVTNATVIDDRIGKLIGDTFSTLTVSVDGADRDTYEYVRVGSSWDKLHRGLDNINRHRQPGFQLIIGVVMLKCNIHQMADFVRFTKEYGGQEFQAAWLVPFHDLPWTQTQAVTDDPEQTNAYLDEARAVGRELGVSVRIPDNLPTATQRQAPIRENQSGERGADRAGTLSSTIIDLDHKATYWDLHGTTHVSGQCQLMYDRCMILVDGTLKPCGQSRSVTSLGNVHDQSFFQRWNSDGYQQLRAEFNSGTLPVTCRSCNFIRSKQLGSARLVYDDQTDDDVATA